jgi:hypothetical protein
LRNSGTADQSEHAGHHAASDACDVATGALAAEHHGFLLSKRDAVTEGEQNPYFGPYLSNL